MLHNCIKDDNSGDHWGVSYNANGQVLVQLQESGEQVRLGLNLDHAKAMYEKLAQAIEKASQCAYIIHNNNGQIQYLETITPEVWTSNKNKGMLFEDSATAQEIIVYLLKNNTEYSPLKIS